MGVLTVDSILTSSIFTALATQDYDVTVISSSYESTYNFTGWKTLENNVWTSVYATNSVQGYTDALIIIDRVSFDIKIYRNWTYAPRRPAPSDCDVGPSRLHNETTIMGFLHASDTNRTLTQVPGPRVM